MTEAQAVALVAVLQAAYPRQELREETIRLYAAMLRDLEFVSAEQAVKRIIASSPYWPAIAEIRNAVAEAETGLPSPEEAWEEVRRAVRDVGSYGRPQWSNPVLARAVESIGWLQICLSEQPGVERAHFLRVYESLRSRAVLERNVAPLLNGERRGEALPLADVLPALVAGDGRG